MKMTLSEALYKEKVKIELLSNKIVTGKICEYFNAEDENEEYDSFVFREAPGKEFIIYINEIKSIEEVND